MFQVFNKNKIKLYYKIVKINQLNIIKLKKYKNKFNKKILKLFNRMKNINKIFNKI